MADRKSCDQCPATFARRSGLWSHKQTHSGVKRYKCLQCNKSFGRAGNLKTHSLIHTGEKSHKCNQCNFSANQTAHLRTHIMKHTGETIQMQPMQLCFNYFKRSEAPQKDPLWGKASQMQNVRVFQH